MTSRDPEEIQYQMSQAIGPLDKSTYFYSGSTPCNVGLKISSDHTIFPMSNLKPDSTIFIGDDPGHRLGTDIHCYCHQKRVITKGVKPQARLTIHGVVFGVHSM